MFIRSPCTIVKPHISSHLRRVLFKIPFPSQPTKVLTTFLSAISGLPTEASVASHNARVQVHQNKIESLGSNNQNVSTKPRPDPSVPSIDLPTDRHYNMRTKKQKRGPSKPKTQTRGFSSKPEKQQETAGNRGPYEATYDLMDEVTKKVPQSLEQRHEWVVKAVCTLRGKKLKKP